MKNLIMFKQECYTCHASQNRSYSLDEIKILEHIKEKYIPEKYHRLFRTAETGPKGRGNLINKSRNLINNNHHSQKSFHGQMQGKY